MTESPARFRPKPAEIEAIQYTGSNADAVAAFAGEGYTYGSMTGALVLHAPAAEIYVHDGDWVVRVGDRIRIFEPAAFAAAYEAAPEPLELSEVERVAVEHTEHMSTCHEPACVDCMKELRAVRRTIKAVEPVIEQRAYRLGYGHGRDDEAAGEDLPEWAAAGKPEAVTQE